MRPEPLLFGDELRVEVLFARVVLARPAVVLAAVLLLVPRPEADLAPAVFAALTLAPAALAPEDLAALLAVLRAVLRAADAGLAAPLERLLREFDADLLALRALLLERVPRERDVVLAAVRRDELPVVLRPGVIDLANCSRSLIRERFVDFASRRRVRSASATSL